VGLPRWVFWIAALLFDALFDGFDHAEQADDA
jgi:hypothetical protein